MTLKSESAVAIMVGILIGSTALYLTGHMLGLFYIFMGEENYEIRLDVLLYPVENNRGELIDVDVRFESNFARVRIPHEVVSWDKIESITSGYRLFSDQEGSLTVTLNLKIENFTRVVYTRQEQVQIPTNHTFIIYFKRSDANRHTILQLTVQAEKKLSLITLRTPISDKWSYVEKWEV